MTFFELLHSIKGTMRPPLAFKQRAIKHRLWYEFDFSRPDVRLQYITNIEVKLLEQLFRGNLTFGFDFEKRCYWLSPFTKTLRKEMQNEAVYLFDLFGSIWMWWLCRTKLPGFGDRELN
jgi:hypothetical protein